MILRELGCGRRLLAAGMALAGSLIVGSPAAAVQAPNANLRLPVPGAPMGLTAFVDVAVIPLDTERILPHQTVLVEQGWITALGAVNEIMVPAGATRIDGRGKYLIPGLSDMHLHTPSFKQMYAQELDEPFAPEGMREAESQLFLELANGVTTVRIMNGRPSVLTLRERATHGELWSPRLVVSSPAVYNRYTPAEAVQMVVDAKAAGYDFIKVYSDSEVWDSTVATARRLGMPMAGHPPSDERGLEGAIRAGYRSAEHLYGADWYLMQRDTAYQGHPDFKGEPGPPYPSPWSAVEDTNVRQLAAALRQANVWLCPTNVVHYRSGWVKLSEPEKYAVRGIEARYVAGDTRYRDLPSYSPAELDSLLASATAKTSAAPAVQRRRRLTKALFDAGVHMLLGTDFGSGVFGSSVVPGFGVHEELAEFVAAGLRPYDALVIAARNPAEFLGWLDSAGTIAVGKRADLVLLSGNPLENIHATAQPAGVMIGGRWLDRAALDIRLRALEGTLGEDP